VRGDNRCAGVGSELDGEGADAAVGSYHQDGVALGDTKRIQGTQSGNPGHRGGAGRPELNAGRLPGYDRLGDGDQVGPAAGVHGRAHPRDEAEYLIADRDASHVGTSLFYDAGVVAAEHDRELVLDHVLEHPGRDGSVNRIDRGGVNAHEHLVRGDLWGRDFVQGGAAVETL
jgi:hypothetical protein